MMDSYLTIKNLKVGFQSYSGLNRVVDIDDLTIERGRPSRWWGSPVRARV